MKLGNEDKKKLIIAGVAGFVAILCLYPLYNALFGGPPASVPPPAVVVNTNAAPVRPVVGISRAAQKVGSTSAPLDPTLHMDAMLVTEGLVYTGSGRNIFAGPSSTPPAPKLAAIVKPIAPVRPVAPIQPVQVVNQGPPPPPPINLKFFGTATTANGVRRAFLLNGDDVFLASVGDIVQRKYKVITIAANSIVIEDLPNNNKQTLPLLGN